MNMSNLTMSALLWPYFIKFFDLRNVQFFDFLNNVGYVCNLLFLIYFMIYAEKHIKNSLS